MTKILFSSRPAPATKDTSMDNGFFQSDKYAPLSYSRLLEHPEHSHPVNNGFHNEPALSESESGVVHNGASGRPFDQIHNQVKVGTARPFSPQSQQAHQSEHPQRPEQPQQTQHPYKSQQAQQPQIEQKKVRQMDASAYLDEMLHKLKERTDLFNASAACVRIYDISSDDIKLRRRRSKGLDE